MQLLLDFEQEPVAEPKPELSGPPAPVAPCQQDNYTANVGSHS